MISKSLPEWAFYSANLYPSPVELSLASHGLQDSISSSKRAIQRISSELGNIFSPTLTTQPVGHVSALQAVAHHSVALLVPPAGFSCLLLQKAFPKTALPEDLDGSSTDGDSLHSLFAQAASCISLFQSFHQPWLLFLCLPHCTISSLRAKNGFYSQRARNIIALNKACRIRELRS